METMRQLVPGSGEGQPTETVDDSHRMERREAHAMRSPSLLVTIFSKTKPQVIIRGPNTIKMRSCSGVKVSCPGIRGAEGQGKRKGVLVRGRLKEAWNERAGRGTRTGYEVWYRRDERARDREVLHPQRAVLYKSGVYAQTV